MIYQGKARYPVTEVILHCAAVPSGWAKYKTAFQVFSEVNRWHRGRGFSGFGYHGLFMPDGNFYRGRPWDMIGAHCIERNRGSIGLLMIESRQITEMATFDTWYTEQQRDAVCSKIADLGGITRVTGHNDYAQRLCPGFKVQSRDWL